MSLLFKVIYAHRANGTHHKIAMDALRLLDGGVDGPWARVFLQHAGLYLRGAKAPDDEFRDSQNQVLHVRDQYWGGAEDAAELWREKLILLLQAGNWREAAYAAGVLSQYYADPIQPLHTAQSEAEGAVHRAIEQSIGKSYRDLIAMAETRAGGFPKITPPAQPRWVARMVRDGAEAAAPHYDALIDHYDLAKGVVDPPAGLDAHLRDVIAGLLGHAISGFAAMLQKIIQESGAAAPAVNLTVQGYLATFDIPIQWLLRKIQDDAEADQVRAMYDEFLATGKVIATMSRDDRMVRAAYAREVLRAPLQVLDLEPARKPGALHGQKPKPVARDTAPVLTPIMDTPLVDAPRPARKARYTLQRPVIDAPAIGEKISAQLEAIGASTIGDLLAADADALSARLANARHTPAIIRDWRR